MEVLFFYELIATTEFISKFFELIHFANEHGLYNLLFFSQETSQTTQTPLIRICLTQLILLTKFVLLVSSHTLLGPRA